MSDSDPKCTKYREHIETIAMEDAKLVAQKDAEYGASWKKRGGVGAFMVMSRKIDRLEEQCRRHGYDIFKAIRDDSTGESLVDTIRDLRCYLDLIEAESRVIQIRDDIDRRNPLRSDVMMTQIKKCSCGHPATAHLSLVGKCISSQGYNPSTHEEYGVCPCKKFMELPG